MDDIREDYVYVKEPLDADSVNVEMYDDINGPGSALHVQLPQLKSTSTCNYEIIFTYDSVGIVSNILFLLTYLLYLLSNTFFYIVFVCSAFWRNSRKL